MTLDEFLDVYVPTVLKPMGGWGILPDGRIRRGDCCPLTAESGRSSLWAGDEGSTRFGMDFDARHAIVKAADDLGHNRQAARARLLAGLGLTEAQ